MSKVKKYKHWYQHKPNEYWICSGQHFVVFTFASYDKKYPHLSKEMADKINELVRFINQK